VTPQPRDGQNVNIVTLLGVGATFGLSVGLGVFLGVIADSAAGTSPLLALLGTLVGILAGAGGAYQIIRPYTRNSSSRPRTAEPDNDVRSDAR
jgi:F0F1-type ATP synthase assembly protein I